MAFDEAWREHSRAHLDPDVLADTQPAWERAYDRVPATAGDEAVGRLMAMFERGGV